MILAESNHLLISPSYRNRFSAKQASNPSVALKQENREITHVERQQFNAVCLWGISRTSIMIQTTPNLHLHNSNERKNRSYFCQDVRQHCNVEPEIRAGPRGVGNMVCVAVVWDTNHSLKADMFKLLC